MCGFAGLLLKASKFTYLVHVYCIHMYVFEMGFDLKNSFLLGGDLHCCVQETDRKGCALRVP